MECVLHCTHMVRRATYKAVTWVDLENPTQSEVRALMDEFAIEPIVADELLSPTLRPKVDVHEKFIYLILHFPIAHAGHVGDMDHKKTQEVDFIIGKHFLITTHYDSIDALHDFSKIFEVNSILDKTKMGIHAGYVFYYMIQHFYRQLHNHVETIRDAMNDAEQQTFAGNEHAMVKELSILNRMLLTYKSALTTHHNVLQSFEQAGTEFFGNGFVYHLRGIVGEYFKVSQALESTKEYLHELRSTNDSLLFTKQNEIMKNLTIMSLITFPLSLVAAIFGMNTVHTPLIGTSNDFFIITLSMLVLVVCMFIFFKKKRWI